jgi:hypothetical protein
MSRIPGTRVMFSPKGGASKELVRLIKAAKGNIAVAAYAFSSKYLGTALPSAPIESTAVPLKHWVTGLVPTLIAGGFFGVRKWSDLAFDGTAGVPLPFFRDLQRVSYADRIRYLEGNRLPRSRIGFGDWDAIAAPGHTEESVVFFNEASGELISGDLILGRKDGRGYVNRFCWDEDQIRRTFAALTEMLRVRIIFPGHGPVVWSAEDAFQKVDCFGEAPAQDGSFEGSICETRNVLRNGRSGRSPRRKWRS